MFIYPVTGFKKKMKKEKSLGLLYGWAQMTFVVDALLLDPVECPCHGCRMYGQVS
jgi:hypothetical protein